MEEALCPAAVQIFGLEVLRVGTLWGGTAGSWGEVVLLDHNADI